MILRSERPGDGFAIRKLTEDAFRPKSFSDGTEGALIDALRNDGALMISTVAMAGETLVGHVAFSPAAIGTQSGWVALGPVAVRADYQRTGVGTRLIEDGLAQLRATDALGCVLMGDPAYYGRFGFKTRKTLTFGGQPSRHIQVLVFGGATPSGEVHFHPAFGTP